MSQKDNLSLDTLLGDVYNASDITPEQLLQYLENPDSLSGEEKQAIADQLETSPALADELRVLENFSLDNTETFATAVANKVESDKKPLFASLTNKLFATPWLPAGAMAIAVAVVSITVFKNDDNPAVPRVVEKTPVKPIEPVKKNQAPLVAESNLPENKEPIRTTPDKTEKNNTPIKRKPIMLAALDLHYQSPYKLDNDTVVRGNNNITLLAPALANTTSTYPKLYWLTDTTIATGELLFELINENSGEIILSTTLIKPKKAGRQKIDLLDYNIRLDNNAIYEWTITWERDANNPNLDQFASAKIKYQPSLTPKLYNVSDKERAKLYAQNGYWYEALHESIKLKERYPDNEHASKDYNTLLNYLDH